MSEPVSILEKIFSIYPVLFDAEKRVADYVLQNEAKVVDMTVSDLAAACGTSDATVVRFCKKCGCNGFHHLKINMAKEMATKPSDGAPIVGSNELDCARMDVSLRNIFASKQEELRQTLAEIDPAVFRSVVERIQAARFIFCAAMGNTIPVAMDAAYKFNELGLTAISAPVWENMLAMMHTVTPDDVLLAISASGETKDLMRVVSAARGRGAYIVLVTNQVHSSIARVSDRVLHAVSQERMFFRTFSFSSTRLSMTAVIEAVYYMLLSVKRDSSALVDTHEQRLSEQKL